MPMQPSYCRYFSFPVAVFGLAVACAVVEAQPQAQPGVSTTVTATPQGASATTSVVIGPAAASFHASRVVVRFRAGATFLPGSASIRVLSATNHLHLAAVPPGLSVAETVARYKSDPNVLYAEPDYAVKAVATPNDPAFAPSQWDMINISAPAAWDLKKFSPEMVVVIIDTGIDYSHPDLQGNLYSDAVTPSIHGYTCIGGACVPGGQDDFGHGTHVAGTIGAATNNSIGMAGIDWQVKLLSMKFLDSRGSGYISDAVLAFNLVHELKTRVSNPVNIRVTSNSWGGGGYSQALKDAMTQVEADGILDVCAAGNSGVNADVNPMYPAAYDNRGIVSVLAIDSANVGASFTNYGLASVDLAAPGVSTYSTVPIGTPAPDGSSCGLCDPSGYKYLSGTSMATPHVSGVAAAMLSLHPGLSAAQARDALLRPASYDAVSDPKGQSTSTGGRLNFFKVLSNSAFFNNSTLNTFPTLTMGPNVFAASGGPVNLTATASDPDGDATRMAWGNLVSTGSQWLFGYELTQLFPNTASYTAPSLARTATVPNYAGVADGRGGGASGVSYVTVSSSASPGGAPFGSLSVPATGTVGIPVVITFNRTDPEGGPVYWDLWASGNGGANGICCYSGSSTSVTFGAAGVYRIGVQGIDRELNTSPRYSAVIAVDSAPATPPLAAASLDILSGPVPLTVNIDMSASTPPPGGTITNYFFLCGTGFGTGTPSPLGSCTFTTPGAYWVELEVLDSNGNVDVVNKYVVATPVPPSGDTTAPTVTITNPTAGAGVSGTVALQASAADNAGGSGVKQVAYYLDSTVPGALIGTSAGPSPYTINWNSSPATPGAHTIYAIATDIALNASSPASVNVSVNVVNPKVTLAAPANGAQLARKTNVSMTSSVTAGSYPVTRVDYLANGSVVCSGTVAPSYSCTWKTPAAPKTYQIQARVSDNHSNTGLSAINTVAVK